ncbi:MAG: acyltransferase family protein [Fimbriimonadaceae bacterium]
MNPKPRIECVDALRGLLASGIMFFHVFGWTNLLQTGTWHHFWNWLGIYGVEMFFVISGFSMAYVYLDRPLLTKNGLVDFFWKRFMRLWPLYFTAFLIATAFRFITHDMEGVNAKNAILHATLLFGFIDPSIKGIIGGWSIGVEVVCYAAFPFLIWAWKKTWSTFILFTALTAIAFFWSTTQLDPSLTLEPHWAAYVNPINHVFLFAMGMLIAKYFLEKRHSPANLFSRIILAFVSGITLFTPLTSTDLATVTGMGRIVFVVLSFFLCLQSATQIKTPEPLAKILNPIGLWSYSIYLLHPFAFQGLKLAGIANQPILHASLTIVSTFLLAKFSYQYLEKPSVNWARKKSDLWFKTQTEPINASSSK